MTGYPRASACSAPLRFDSSQHEYCSILPMRHSPYAKQNGIPTLVVIWANLDNFAPCTRTREHRLPSFCGTKPPMRGKSEPQIGSRRLQCADQGRCRNAHRRDSGKPALSSKTPPRKDFCRNAPTKKDAAKLAGPLGWTREGGLCSIRKTYENYARCLVLIMIPPSAIVY